MKRVVILYNLNRNQYEYETEFDSELTINSILEALKDSFEVKKVEAVKDFSWIERVRELEPDLVFNICEGFHGPARESVYAAILEQLEFNYSGPDSTNLLICHNKFLAKNLVKDITRVPYGYIVRNLNDIERLKNIQYPVMVKLNSEGSSMGMNEKSVVSNFIELQEQVKWLLNKYNRNILIEKYIEGKDISMVYVEGLGALGPCQVECESLFYDYEMKTIKDSTVDIFPLDGTYKKLKETVMEIVKRLDIKGYAKLDFRMQNGEYYLIEVNSQVSFHPTGEFITCCKKDGYDFNEIIKYIVENALKTNTKINSTGIGE